MLTLFELGEEGDLRRGEGVSNLEDGGECFWSGDGGELEAEDEVRFRTLGRRWRKGGGRWRRRGLRGKEAREGEVVNSVSQE